LRGKKVGGWERALEAGRLETGRKVKVEVKVEKRWRQDGWRVEGVGKR